MRILLLSILSLLICQSVAAVVIEQVTTDKESYADGELITITMYANAKNLQVTADFSKVDSNFRQGMVNVEAQDFTYKIYYPITFSNLNRDGDYPIPISIYNKFEDKSSIAQAIVTLNNAETNRTTESASILLKVRKGTIRPNGTVIDVREGQIMVCSATGCQTLSEAEYEQARDIIINSGKVKLSNLTYEQLKAEVLADIQGKNAEELQMYVNRLIKIDNDVQDSLYNAQRLIKDSQLQMENQSNITQKLVKRTEYIQWGSILAVVGLIGGLYYILYLKTNTTHLD